MGLTVSGVASVFGGDGNDKIYGGNNLLVVTLHGDPELGYGDYNDEDGGDDQIWAGDGGSVLNIIGGQYNDKIYAGSDTNTVTSIFGDKQTGGPLVEDPDGFNKFDGDDVIEVGDNNATVQVFGQGGNDKIIGGVGQF